MKLVLVIFSLAIFLAQECQAVSNSYEARKTYAIIEDYSKGNEYFPEAKGALVEGYLKCTDSVVEAENTVLAAFSVAEEIAATQPNAAKEIVNKAIQASKKLISLSGLQVFKGLGSALGLANDGAKEGLLKCSQLTQTGGVDSLNGIILANNMVSQGSSSQGNSAKQAFIASRRIAKTALNAVYDGVQKSFPIAIKALRDAYEKPQSSNTESDNSEAAANDQDASDAIREINQYADSSRLLLSNSTLANELRKELIHAIADLAKIAADARATVERIRSNDKIDLITAKVIFFRAYEQFKADIGNAVGKALLAMQSVASRSNNILSTHEIDGALTGVITSRIKLDFVQIAAADLVCIGLAHEGDTLQSAFDAAIESGKFAKLDAFDSVVSAAKIVSNLL